MITLSIQSKLAFEQTGTDSTHLQKSFLTMDVAWISDYWISGDILITESNNKTKNLLSIIVSDKMKISI